MIIAHISDLHVVEQGTLCQGKVDTYRHLQEAVEHLNQADPQPDLVFASGDISEHSTGEQYEAVNQILTGLRQPIYLIPGNHDRRDLFLEAFRHHDYLPPPGSSFAHYVIEEYPVRLIGLDTTVPGQGHGMLCDQRLAWLDAALSAAPAKPTMIFMHHPPFRTGIRWIDAAGLRGGRKMEAIVARHPQVNWVACGHVHRPIQLKWAGTMASTIPSVSHVQVGLTLSESNGYDFLLTLEPRVVQLYLHDQGYGMLSHASYVDGTFKSFQPPNVESRREEYTRQYAMLCQDEYDNSTGDG